MVHSVVTAWDRLTSLAMLGLARHASAVDDLLPDAAVKLPEGSREEGLLRCAAAALLARLAGQRSAVAETPATARAADIAERVIADSALRFLARLSAEGPKELIGEWFTCASKSGRVLPPQWIPAVFELLTAELRCEYASVFGARINWLADQDVRWAIEGFGQECDERNWQTGSVGERVAVLKRVRATDPDTGRAWLQGTWATDAPEAREAFLQALKIGLSNADEVFLEQALDDKRKSVRLAAANHLSRLSESAFMQRALERLRPAFEFEPRPAGLLAKFSSRKFRIELPPTLDKAALRDGIELKPPASAKVGERSFWLIQMLSVPPPREWSRRFDCSATELLDAVARSDHAEQVFTALCAACVRHPDGEWIDALCAGWRARAADQGAGAVAGIAALLAALPTHERDQHVQAQVKALLNQDLIDLSLQLLTSTGHAWSSSTTSLACEVLLMHIRGSAGPSYLLGPSALESWGRRMEIASAAPSVQRILDKIGAESPFRNAVERLLKLIEFRIDMHKELLS
jgi:hypothetical protein